MFRRLPMLLCCLIALNACHNQESTQSNNNAASAISTANKSTKTHEIQGEKVTIKTNRGEVTVPLNPERIAVYDWGMLDTLNKLGVKIGASTDDTRLDYLQNTIQNSKKAGTLFEPNFEVLYEYKPQLIITGSRTAKAFDKLNELAPTIEMTAETQNMLTSAKERIDAMAKIFKKEAEAEKLKAEIDHAFTEAKTAAKNQGKGLVIQISGGKLSAYGQNSRLGGWIHRDIGLPAVDTQIQEGSHGQPISFEYIKDRNPDWLFVLDRDAAIGAKNGQAAKVVLNNPLIAETTAWKKGHVVYLLPSAYLAAGGAQQLIDSANQVSHAFKTAK